MLSEKEALQRMELPADANPYEVETRYAILLKRYRHDHSAEARDELARITQAYELLTGRTQQQNFVDPRLEKMIFGKTLYQWKNIWHYRRLTVLVVAIVLFFVGSIVHSMLTNPDPDYQIALVGIFQESQESDQLIGDYVRSKLDDVELVQTQLIPLSFKLEEPDPDDPFAGTNEQLQSSYVIKMMTMFAVDTIDLYICEDTTFNQYAAQGVFQTLDELYARLAELPSDISDRIKPLRRDPGPESEEEEENQRPLEVQNEDLSLPICGLEVTALDPLRMFDYAGPSQIITIGKRAKDPEETARLIEEWLVESKAYDS